jgi:hypothetical protein
MNPGCLIFFAGTAVAAAIGAYNLMRHGLGLSGDAAAIGLVAAFFLAGWLEMRIYDRLFNPRSGEQLGDKPVLTPEDKEKIATAYTAAISKPSTHTGDAVRYQAGGWQASQGWERGQTIYVNGKAYTVKDEGLQVQPLPDSARRMQPWADYMNRRPAESEDTEDPQ